jgi:hypothetical protein
LIISRISFFDYSIYYAQILSLSKLFWFLKTFTSITSINSRKVVALWFFYFKEYIFWTFSHLFKKSFRVLKKIEHWIVFSRCVPKLPFSICSIKQSNKKSDSFFKFSSVCFTQTKSALKIVWSFLLISYLNKSVEPHSVWVIDWLSILNLIFNYN